MKDSNTLMKINKQIIQKKIIVDKMYTLTAHSGDEAVLVDYKNTAAHTKVPACSNPILASFVSSYGRIKLYESLKLIGERSL